MRDTLLPVLLIAVLPGLFLAYRLGLLGRRRQRWAFAAIALAAVLWAVPWHGVDFRHIKYYNLLLATATAVLMLLRHYRVAWTRHRGLFDGALLAIAGLALLAYVNFLAFHGVRTFVHLHDVAHYYLGSKYHAELGYSDLYTAMLRAEAENHDNRFKAIEARDLETYEQVHIRRLLQKSEPVKDRFSAARWEAFKSDSDYFREALGVHYAGVLVDHGFNPTPFWALVGGSLANLVPAGSARGILFLTLIDPLLLLASVVAVAAAFGRRTALVAAIYFCVLFGATFGWTGGAFLRYGWFFAVVVAACALHRRRPAVAGALLAVAALLRVFPAFFVLPLAAKAAWCLVGRRQPALPRRLPRRYRRFFVGFAITGLLGFAVTGLLPRGLAYWGEFQTNMRTHLANVSPNIVGLTEALAYRGGGPEKVSQAELDAIKRRRLEIRRAQLSLVAVPLGLLVAAIARRRTDLGALALALPLLWAGLSLAAYYYVFLVLLVLVHRASPGRLALVFAVEAATYSLWLVEDRDALVHIYRGLLVAFLYLALDLEPLRRELRALGDRFRLTSESSAGAS